MNEKLQQLEKVLGTINPPLIRYLDNGADSRQITDLFKNYSLSIADTSTLYALFAWHNGTNLNEEEHCLNFCLFPDFILMSLDDVRECIETDHYFNFKGKGLIPLFRSCGGDFLAIKAREYDQSPQSASVYFCSPRVTTDDNYISMYDSLDTMIDCILLSYERSYYFINPEDNLIDRDIDEIYHLSERLNPGSQYWTSDEVL